MEVIVGEQNLYTSLDRTIPWDAALKEVTLYSRPLRGRFEEVDAAMELEN